MATSKSSTGKANAVRLCITAAGLALGLAHLAVAQPVRPSQQGQPVTYDPHTEPAVKFAEGPPPRNSRDPDYRFRTNPVCVRAIQQAKATVMVDEKKEGDVHKLARSCAYAHDFERRKTAAFVARFEMRRQSELVMDIPEFHDEQRLPADAPDLLGPVAGIYTTPFAGAFRHRWQFVDHRTPGVLAGFVVIIQENNEPFPNSYRNLGLAWGMNCIFLEPKGTDEFIARVSQPQANQPCRAANGVVTFPSPATLDVKVIRNEGFTQDSMIPAARFLEDSEGRTVFGLPCLADWCEIGLPGFSRATNSYCNWAFGGTCPNRKEYRIASWYDEQRLEVWDGSNWKASSMRAAIVPEPNIADFSTSDYLNTKRLVSTMYFEADPPTNTKLYQRGVRKGRNTVELINDVAGGNGWQYIINGRPNGVKILGPHRHYDAPIPGTSRWRFTMLDPGIWGPCGQYCCDSDGT